MGVRGRALSRVSSRYPTRPIIWSNAPTHLRSRASFSNNGAEWAMGFWLGLSLGVLFAARAPAPAHGAAKAASTSGST